MAAELGKMPKPSVDTYSTKRKLLFVPLIFAPPESPLDFIALFNKYWEQIDTHLHNLESKLGNVTKIYHEMVPKGADDLVKAVEELNEASSQIIKRRLEQNAELQPIEDMDILTEFMDWSKCLIIGLQNPRVITKVHQAYMEAQKKRSEEIIKTLDESLGQGDIGLLFMIEGHHIQFPSDIEVFYIAPPALDEIKRWSRSQEVKSRSEQTAD